MTTMSRRTPSPWRGPPLDAKLQVVMTSEDAAAICDVAQRHGRSISGELRMATLSWLDLHGDGTALTAPTRDSDDPRKAPANVNSQPY